VATAAVCDPARGNARGCARAGRRLRLPGLLAAGYRAPLRPGGAGDHKRRWLAFSLQGCISSRVEDGHSVIEVAFHDAASHKRVPLFSDFRDFCQASLGPKVTPRLFLVPSHIMHIVCACLTLRMRRVQGALYASAAAPRSPSALVYRPFQSWTAGGNWSLTLPAGSSALCVAVGRSYCAAATSDRLLRVLTLSGTPRLRASELV